MTAMTSPVCTLALCSALAVGPSPAPSSAPTSVARSPDPSEQPQAKRFVPTYVVVDCHALADAQEVEYVRETHDYLSERVPGLFRGLVPLEAEHGPGVAKLRVALSWSDYGKSLYTVVITAELPGGERHEERFELRGDEYTVLERLETQVDTYVAWLEATDDAAEPAEKADEPAAAPPEATDEPLPPPPSQKRLSPMGWAGIGVGIAGLGAGIVGTVLFTRTEEGFERNPSGVEALQRRKHPAPVTVGLMVGGGVLLATGATLLGIDLRRSSRQHRASISPQLSDDGLGFSVSGRF